MGCHAVVKKLHILPSVFVSNSRISRVVSRGRCNTGSKSTRRSFKTQGLSRPLIQTQSDLVQV
jgi:hypothetical protein